MMHAKAVESNKYYMLHKVVEQHSKVR